MFFKFTGSSRTTEEEDVKMRMSAWAALKTEVASDNRRSLNIDPKCQLITVRNAFESKIKYCC